MHQSYAEIVAVIESYFDGLYHSDTKRLAAVFHPRAHYVTVTDGSLTHRSMDEYFPIVAARPSPASRGEARRDTIVSIAFAGPVTAAVRLNCVIAEKYFTDLLNLVKLDGRWQIVSKVFHYDIVDP